MNDLNHRLTSVLRHANLDALLVTRDANQRYLEGYTGSECYLLISYSSRWLIADSRYSEQASQECRTAKVIQHRDPSPPYAEVIAALVRENKLSTIGFEKTVLSYGQYETIIDEIGQLAGFIPTEGIVERLRMVKRFDECKRIRTACVIADRALENTLVAIRAGMSELELARELEFQIVREGGEGTAFPTIAAFGPRTSQPHAVPNATIRLKRGDLILLDFGARYQGYRSDITRTFVFGCASDRQKSAYAAVLESQLKGIAAIRPGIGGSEPDAVSRQHLLEAGWPEFGYGVGHGVGLEVHELPNLSRKSDQILEAGMVVTVEPGVYVPGWGGIRIEDTVLIGETGSECLTGFRKNTLIEI